MQKVHVIQFKGEQLMMTRKYWSSLALQSKEEGKVQELIQSSTTPDLDTVWESDKNTREHNTQESQEDSPFPAGDHKAARNRQDSITKKNKTKRIHKRSTPLERSVEKKNTNQICNFTNAGICLCFSNPLLHNNAFEIQPFWKYYRKWGANVQFSIIFSKVFKF